MWRFMTKKQIYHIIEWLIAAAACGYLVYRLVVFDDYASVWAGLRTMNAWQWGALALCVALMPVNMALEAWRWKTLIPMSWREAQRQVYYSKLAGLITPWKLGEYPARAVLRNEWSQTLSMGAVGSATMTMAILIAGGIALIAQVLFMESLDAFVISYRYCNLFVAVLLLLIIALVLAPRLLRRWATVSHKLVLVSVGQSLVRLLCWCVQLYLVLFALGGLGDIGVIGNLGQSAVYYLLVTVTPNVPIAEAGVRGAWAVVLFGSVNAALAGVLLWVINTLLPCLVWPFLRKNEK
ncbi:MAG: flippase-like domain-containing protein [Paludibacteraceae bacterium]|nr:flippase-like domain-containing protein [Paludibacteraceae bacterium]